MCTALYVFLSCWLDSWEEEPFASCFGLCLFLIMDVYLISRFLQALIVGEW